MSTSTATTRRSRRACAATPAICAPSPDSPRQLLEIGRADLERNTHALKDACAQYLPGGTLPACVERLRADKPSGGAVEGARAQLLQLREFIVARNIVTIPSDERPQVAEAPPYNRSNFAYINVPGPYEKGVAYIYNIAPPDAPNTSADVVCDCGSEPGPS